MTTNRKFEYKLLQNEIYKWFTQFFPDDQTYRTLYFKIKDSQQWKVHTAPELSKTICSSDIIWLDLNTNQSIEILTEITIDLL